MVCQKEWRVAMVCQVEERMAMVCQVECLVVRDEETDGQGMVEYRS